MLTSPALVSNQSYIYLVRTLPLFLDNNILLPMPRSSMWCLSFKNQLTQPTNTMESLHMTLRRTLVLTNAEL
jgi:hypothetical protein